MDTLFSGWIAAAVTVAILLAYEISLLLIQRRSPQRLARSAHAGLREEWMAALSRQPSSEILAVQTLRNALMSATMTASTAALALIGAVTLSAPSVGVLAHFSTRLALELMLMTMLFASLVCSAMAVRYYNHAGFVLAMPVGSEERGRWAPTAAVYLRRAGLLYSWGLRHLLMVAPILAAIVYPLAGPVAAVLVILALAAFDRFPG
ncbi:MAG: DUF599 domain-containing protein [Pseudomonadota bacterium]